MKRLSKKRLLDLGFKIDFGFRYWKGGVSVEIYPNDKTMVVYISSGIAYGADYDRKAMGVKNAKDLIDLCRLVNGV